MDISAFNRDELTLMGAGACTMLSLHFSLQLASQHLYYWKKPDQQRAILIIILMPPIYAVYSFVGVLNLKQTNPFLLLLMLLNFVKDCYEAFVISNFLALLYSYLNLSVTQNIVPDEIKGRQVHHLFPVTLFIPRSSGLNPQTLKLVKYLSWQFVIIRPMNSFLVMSLKLFGMYPPSWFSWTSTIILNISCCVAMYSLLLFSHVFAKELKPHKPLAKFLCVQGVVFFCFWQGVLLDILEKTGVIKAMGHLWVDVEHVGEAIQNLLICVEMVFFSVFQQYAFHFEPYSGDVQTMLQNAKNKD